MLISYFGIFLCIQHVFYQFFMHSYPSSDHFSLTIFKYILFSQLNVSIVESINKASEAWGISCLRYEIRDIKVNKNRKKVRLINIPKYIFYTKILWIGWHFAKFASMHVDQIRRNCHKKKIIIKLYIHNDTRCYQ